MWASHSLVILNAVTNLRQDLTVAVHQQSLPNLLKKHGLEYQHQAHAKVIETYPRKL